MITPNKTQKLILEVIANNSGHGISASEIQNELAGKESKVISYCTIINYLAGMVDTRQLRRRTRRAYDGKLWSSDYYINKRTKGATTRR